MNSQNPSVRALTSNRLAVCLVLATSVHTSTARAESCPKVVSKISEIFNCGLSQSAEYRFHREALELAIATEKDLPALSMPKLVVDGIWTNDKYTSTEVPLIGYDNINKTEVGVGIGGKYLDWGIDYQLSALRMYDLKISGQSYYQSGSEAKITAHLNRDFGPRIKDLTYKPYALLSQTRKLELERIREETARELLTTYLSLYLGQRKQAFYQTLFESYSARLKTNEQLEHLGKVSGVNIMSLRDQVLQTKTLLTEQEGKTVSLKMQLCNLLHLNLETCEIGTLQDPGLTVTDEELGKLQKSPRATLSNYFDLRAKKLDLESKTLAVDAQENQIRPLFDLSLKKQIRSDRDPQRQFFGKSDGWEDQIALNFELPLDLSLEKDQLRLKTAEKVLAERRVRESELSATNETQRLINEFQATKKVQVQVEQHLELSRKRVEAARRAQSVGVINLKELIDYETALQEVNLQQQEVLSSINLAAFELLVKLRPNSLFKSWIKESLDVSQHKEPTAAVDHSDRQGSVPKRDTSAQ